MCTAQALDYRQYSCNFLPETLSTVDSERQQSGSMRGHNCCHSSSGADPQDPAVRVVGVCVGGLQRHHCTGLHTESASRQCQAQHDTTLHRRQVSVVALSYICPTVCLLRCGVCLVCHCCRVEATSASNQCHHAAGVASRGDGLRLQLEVGRAVGCAAGAVAAA